MRSRPEARSLVRRFRSRRACVLRTRRIHQHLVSTCSLTSNLNGGILESGVTINNHKLPGSIASTSRLRAREPESADPWTRASYTVGGHEVLLPRCESRLRSGASGLLKVVYRVRNADWVLTAPSRGNNDIEICAGARHGGSPAVRRGCTERHRHIPVHRQVRGGAVECWRRSLLGRPRLRSESLQGEERPCGLRRVEIRTSRPGRMERWRRGGPGRSASRSTGTGRTSRPGTRRSLAQGPAGP